MKNSKYKFFKEQNETELAGKRDVEMQRRYGELGKPETVAKVEVQIPKRRCVCVPIPQDECSYHVL